MPFSMLAPFMPATSLPLSTEAPSTPAFLSLSFRAIYLCPSRHFCLAHSSHVSAPPTLLILAFLALVAPVSTPFFPPQPISERPCPPPHVPRSLLCAPFFSLPLPMAKQVAVVSSTGSEKAHSKRNSQTPGTKLHVFARHGHDLKGVCCFESAAIKCEQAPPQAPHAPHSCHLTLC